MPEQGSSRNPTSRHSYVDEQGWHVCVGLALFEAEELLDWLDMIGCASREVHIDTSGTTVRWHID